jgi:hypothetical protein
MRGLSNAWRFTLAVVVLLSAGATWAGSAQAVAPSPGWAVDSFATPTNFSVSDNARCVVATVRSCDEYRVTVRNAGSRESSGPVILTDVLPAGLTVQEIHLAWSAAAEVDFAPYFCKVEVGSGVVACEFPVGLQPEETLLLSIPVTVDQTAVPGPITNRATVGGGGALTVSSDPSSSTNEIGETHRLFGLSGFDFSSVGPDGSPDAQTGDHPYELTTTIDLNNDMRVGPNSIFAPNDVEDVRDVVVNLPVGFTGSILSAPQCTFSQLSSRSAHGESGCPADTVVGHIFTEPVGLDSIDGPIYNMTPERGVPAEFAYIDLLGGPHVFYVHVVPTSSGYVIQTINPDIPQLSMTRIEVSFWGDPAERDGTNNAPIPFFTEPSSCSGEVPTARIYMDSWQKPAKFSADGSPADLEEAAWAKAESKLPAMSGCNALKFPVETKAQPTTHEADKPSGLDYEIKLPQSEVSGVPATPSLKKAVVELPEGFTIDPSAGDGLQACTVAQGGWVGPNHLNFNATRPVCPQASKIGSLTLESPLVGHQLEGEMYLAQPYENPFRTSEHPTGSLLAAYVVVDDPITGVLIKIAGKFEPDPRTGRLTAEFDENPSLPFSDLQLHFFGGPRAELATPESCDTFTVHSELSPWSAPDSGPAASSFDSFLIDEACPRGFAPSFAAGSTNLQGGAYTSLVASFGRSDTDQEVSGLSVTLPAGLLANLSGVPLCTDAQVHEAETGSGGCPQASQVGTVQTGVGPGPDSLFVAGQAYLTGPYNGGPYGLAVVVPALAGPFNFGTVVVRQSLRIDPTTARVTDVSDAFPTIIDGIPLRLRRVDLTLDRPNFTFNPTNCSKLGFAGSISGSPLGAPRTLNGTVGYATQAGVTSSFTTPFQVTNCSMLGFKPLFKVSTSGKTSRANGVRLQVKLTYPKAPFGSQANIKSVKVNLPKQLPSRLTTLQKACPDAVFNANPASCPPASRVGAASARTPILSPTLTGPAYFVSHGGEKFPELVIVLSANGITVDLHGETFISKTGITSSTFRQVPDVPIGSFELTLPEGKYSALAANGNLCKRRLKMPTAFTAQNGAVIHQSTPIAVTGCRKASYRSKRRRK